MLKFPSKFGVFPGDADFANAILMITHQIPQPEGNIAPKYAVETIVDSTGDCDVFSILAASLMKAGGLDVIMLEYPTHMNLGVYLQNEPSGIRTGQVVWMPLNGKNYYIAETTGGYGDSPWMVGEDPSGYGKATVIPLTNIDYGSPGQVTAELKLVKGPPIISLPFVGYVMLGFAGTLVAGWFVIRCLPRSTKRSAKENSTGYEQEKSTTETKNIPSDAWCMCSKCGAYISANIEYCPCGEKLPKRRETGRTIVKIKREEFKIEQNKPPVPTFQGLPAPYWCACPKCGAWIGIDTRNCPFCNAILPVRVDAR